MKRKKAWGSPADTSGHCDSSSMDTRRIYAIRLYIWWRMMLKELRRGPMRQKPAHTNPVATHLHTNLVSLRNVQFGVKKVKSGFTRRLRGVRKWIRGAMRQRAHSVWKIRVNMLVETENQINTENITKEDDATTCPLSQNNCNTSVCNTGKGHIPSSGALMTTECLSIISTQLHSAFTVSAGLNLYSSWQFICPMSEQKSAQLG